MEVKTLSESEAVSLPDSASDPEEQEFSDDDRNHKHRRRDTRSQSLDRDQPEQFSSRTYRKHGKPFENGHTSKDSDPQSHYTLDREFPSKFGRRSLVAKSSQFSSNANQRFRTNQSFSGDFGIGRGRGRNSGSWNQRDSRFTPMDIASQMAPPGPLPPVFAGRGFHNVANTQSLTWAGAGGFGLIPGIPNGAMDPIHPLGLQGAFRPPLNPSLNMGIPRQRCRDFEERGFCLRGDMCPMEHGVHRIVVEDVQSLSQFNLPASLPSGHLLGNPGGNGHGPTAHASSSALMNNKGLAARANKSGIDDGSYALGGDGNGADVYDPDQPLWNSDNAQTSTGVLSMQPPPTGDIEPLMEIDPSDQLVSSSGASLGLQDISSSAWGRMNPLKNKMDSGGRADSRVNSATFPETRIKEKSETYASLHGKRTNTGELVSSSSRAQNDYGRLMRKPTQKALRTLFVSYIPLKDNKKEALFSHFKKFGEVIDIHIPPNSDLAFVQFSKREEAEGALKSPDAVMGNRFIKLLWANRDTVSDDSVVGRNTFPKLSANSMNKESIQLGVPNPSAPYSAKPPASNVPTVLTEPPAKKKENLEVLKEELRKKQETLERKRNEFRQQLDKLQKHATGTKGEVPEVQPTKKLKVEGSDASPKQLNLHANDADLPAQGSVQKSQPVENVASPRLKTKFSSPMLESSNLKHAVYPLTYAGNSFPTNRYKLDNRPTSIRVNAPLPPEFANVNALREHFALFGEISNIELENSEPENDNASETTKNASACVSFKTRQAAERAFINGKSWNGHSLLLAWLIPGKPSTSHKGKPPASVKPPATELEPLQNPTNTNPQGSSGERGSSLSAAKDGLATEIQSACAISQDSCGGSQTSGAEAQSADKSAIGSSQEASAIPEVAEKDGELGSDENLKLKVEDAVACETQAGGNGVCPGSNDV